MSLLQSPVSLGLYSRRTSGIVCPEVYSIQETQFLASAASSAMEQELCTFPKPGLVDPENQGSHSDMDYEIFIRSINAVKPYFPLVAHGSYARDADKILFRALRKIGIRAENSMFAATGGVNTHKGQIFVLFLLTAAAASTCPDMCSERIQSAVRNMTSGIVRKELSRLTPKNACTHGERLFLQYGVSGVRGEAENGFPSIFNIALPVYSAYLAKTGDRNAAAVHTLLCLMSTVEDTTVLHRGGPKAIWLMRSMSRKAIKIGASGTVRGMKYLRHMNQKFSRHGISPGGCADLLAGTIFIHTILSPDRTYGSFCS